MEHKWYYVGVEYCYKNKYMTGTHEDTFEPNTEMNRAMFVTILYKIANATQKYDTTSFTDVELGRWYSNASEWAYKHGYASGIGNNQFGPNQKMTRETLAQFLYTYSQKQGYRVIFLSDLLQYEDTDQISNWAKKAVKWAVAEGLLSGTDATHISPKVIATRAQVAVIVRKYVSDYVANTPIDVVDVVV